MRAEEKGLREAVIPALAPEQVARFTAGSLRAVPARPFDPDAALRTLRDRDGQEVLAVDIGGDKIAAARYAIRDGRVSAAETVLGAQSSHGAGYLAALTEAAALARQRGLRAGISFAGLTDGTRLVAGPNVPAFAAELGERYGGDFARLLPGAAVANDAAAGLMAAALEAARRYPGTRDVIYLINGSGIGGAVLTGATIYAAEPGHVEVWPALNPLGQARPCGLLGAGHTCVEAVAAGKAGIEDLWARETGGPLAGPDISARYQAGDPLARRLYQDSALLAAHAIAGMAAAFGLDAGPGPVIVGHGGVFHVPGYGELVAAILEQHAGRAPRLLFTRDLGPNTCLDGAAVAAAVA